MNLVGGFKKLALPKNVNSKKTSIAFVSEVQIFQISKVIVHFKFPFSALCLLKTTVVYKLKSFLEIWRERGLI